MALQAKPLYDNGKGKLINFTAPWLVTFATRHWHCLSMQEEPLRVQNSVICWLRRPVPIFFTYTSLNVATESRRGHPLQGYIVRYFWCRRGWIAASCKPQAPG